MVLFFIVALGFSVAMYLNSQTQDIRQSAAEVTCSSLSASKDSCEDVPGCGWELKPITCTLADCNAGKSGCIPVAAPTSPCTMANCSTYSTCTLIPGEAAKTESCGKFGSSGSCSPSGCSWKGEEKANCTMGDCNAGKSGCWKQAAQTTPCTMSNCFAYPSFCTYKAGSSTPGYCSGPSGCSSLGAEECAVNKVLGCSWTAPKTTSDSCTGTITLTPEICQGQYTTKNAYCDGYYTSVPAVAATCKGTYVSGAPSCKGEYQQGSCTGTPKQAATPTPTVAPQPKDCSYAQHQEFACLSMTECVQCVDGQTVPASRADCEKQDKNALCKPPSTTNDCGWANDGEYACKTLTECVRCNNGAMEDVAAGYCKDLPCAPEKPPTLPIEPGSACVATSTQPCTTTDGKQGNQSCTFTKRSGIKPYDCSDNPIDCGTCVADKESDPELTCGAENQSCCKQSDIDCQSGLSCNKNNTCIKPSTVTRFSCNSGSGSCTTSPNGEYLSLGSCADSCEKTESKTPGASCSEDHTKTCTTTTNQAGTQTCTFTRRGSTSPYDCDQAPTDCSTCVATVAKQCAYSSNKDQNERRCALGSARGIMICNQENMWSVSSALCGFQCQNGNCCGSDGQSCCAGEDPCQSGLVCSGGSCRIIGPIEAPPKEEEETKESETIANTPSRPLPAEEPADLPTNYQPGAACTGDPFLTYCDENSVSWCYYSKRDSVLPLACNQDLKCSTCIEIEPTDIVSTAGVTPLVVVPDSCNPDTDQDFCSSDYSKKECLANATGNGGRWYELDCSTRCNYLTSSCNDSVTFAIQQQNYDAIVTAIQNEIQPSTQTGTGSGATGNWGADSNNDGILDIRDVTQQLGNSQSTPFISQP